MWSGNFQLQNKKIEFKFVADGVWCINNDL